ncbi:MAG TPA: alpha-L-fucosidase, partial [Verrucomicrobiae bacterium]
PAKGSSTPDAAYVEKFYKRVQQLIDDYQPDQIYFDDTILPFHGLTDEVGLQLAAHFYNSSIQWHGHNEAVMNNKFLNEMQRRAMVYDLERGRAANILPQPWQTDTCIGSWHYDRNIFLQHHYKSAESVIRMLADIVSKNGNLMLSVPLQRDGQPDADELRIVGEIGDWLRINGEAIYATRPWKIFGEGPALTHVEKGHFDGQADVQKSPFTAEDIRFTQSKDGQTIYAIALALPTGQQLTVKALGTNSPYWTGHIKRVRLVGGGKLKFTRDDAGLHVVLPANLRAKTALALKIQ